MHDDASLPCPRRVTDSAAIAVPLQHRLPQTSEIFLILTAERIAGCTHAMREHRLPSAAAVHRELNGLSLWLHL